MKKVTLLLFVILLAVSQYANNHVNLSDPCNGNTLDMAFAAGERLTYKLYYNLGLVWLPAGELEFRLQNHKNGLHITADGRTYSSYEWFYKVRDHYECVVDNERFLPVWSMRDIEEGDYKQYSELSYDHEAGMIHSIRGRNKNDIKSENFEINTCVQDIVSMIYRMRNENVKALSIGESLPVNFFLDDTTYEVEMKYKGEDDRMKIKGLGKYSVYHFSPNLIGGDIFQEGTEMDIYVSKDQNKVPLLIESPLKVGSVKAVLKSYDGLKHPLNES
jgi:hypothetical protein